MNRSEGVSNSPMVAAKQPLAAGLCEEEDGKGGLLQTHVAANVGVEGGEDDVARAGVVVYHFEHSVHVCVHVGDLHCGSRYIVSEQPPKCTLAAVPTLQTHGGQLHS